MKNLLLFIMMLIVVTFTTSAFANSVGVNFSQALDDVNLGVYGDYEVDFTENLKFGAEGQLQSGDVILGDLAVAVTLGNERIGVRVETNNHWTGHTFDDIGRINDLGASLVFPIGNLEVSGGIFGKSGNPFLPVYELSNPNDPESAVLKEDGLKIKDASTLNLALRTEFDWSRFEIGLRGLFEIAGEGEKVHQGTADIETGGDLFIDGLGWTLQGQVVAQAWGENITWQSSIAAGAKYEF